MTDKQFKLLLILHAAPHSMTALQLKLAGGFWFLPWSHMPGLVNKAWVTGIRGLPVSTRPLSPMFYTITSEGSRALAQEIERRAHS